MKRELLDLDATAQAKLIRQGEVTPLEMVDTAIEAIERVNPQLNAVIAPLFDKGRTQAKGSIPDGPFRGVPFLLKDLGAASDGDPIAYGMRLLRDARYRAPYDTYTAARFKAAGFICVGKSNTPELGLNVTTEPEAFGAAHNPWNLAHSPGGSSGGAAAAVAARLVSVAHATDGGGSIRIPASECGVLGLKPSRGRTSMGPDFGDVWHGLATEGVVSRSVRDTAAALDAIAGNMPGDPYAAPPQRRPFLQEVGAAPGSLRIGVMRRAPQGGLQLNPACIAAVDGAARLLTTLGHQVEESHPDALDEVAFREQLTQLICAHTAQTLDSIGAALSRKLNASDVEPWTWLLADAGRKLSAAQYLTGVQWLQVWSRRVAKWWSQGFDLLLTPSIAAPPPVLGTLTLQLGETTTRPDDPSSGFNRALNLIQFTPQFNVTGQPAVSLPLHWNTDDLPIGVQLVAAFGREDLLIQIASQLEEAQPWAHRKPPVCA